MLYFTKTPWLLKKLYPGCTWNIPVTEKILYLSFDDGPHPEATVFALEQLQKYHARGTFFCVGTNVRQHFSVYEQMISGGHRPGNHTFHHLNGWKTDDAQYLEDIAEAAKIIDSSLFRPPYGKITRFQLTAIAGERFRLHPIMWDVLSGDFDRAISGEECFLNVVHHAQPGSIIVFHDSEKSFPTLQYALPRVLAYFSERNYQFRVIPLAGDKKIGPE